MLAHQCEELLAVGGCDKAKAGEKIFNDTHHDCHQNRRCALSDVGADPRRANSFGQPVAGNKPFPIAIKPILSSRLL
jgi:hypothetical protein